MGNVGLEVDEVEVGVGGYWFAWDYGDCEEVRVDVGREVEDWE